jgi:hypothetical protein
MIKILPRRRARPFDDRAAPAPGHERERQQPGGLAIDVLVSAVPQPSGRAGHCPPVGNTPTSRRLASCGV